MKTLEWSEYRKMYFGNNLCTISYKLNSKFKVMIFLNILEKWWCLFWNNRYYLWGKLGLQNTLNKFNSELNNLKTTEFKLLTSYTGVNLWCLFAYCIHRFYERISNYKR